MKILCKNILLTTAVVCLSCMLSTGVSAKVCFVGDQNCGSGGSFNDYEDQGENACLGVVDENGKQIYQKGPCGNGMQVTAYCPYDSSYVQCCGKEYVYNTPCVYPLVSKGKCGNRYKCECDSSQYKYTDNECKTTKGSALDGFENSYGAGSSCMQLEYNASTDEVTSVIKFSSCQCDRGVYPKFDKAVPSSATDESDCDANAEKNGPCATKYSTSNRSEQYYKFCRCSTSDYPKTDSGCYPLVGDAKQETCFDTIMHYKTCASCDSYPARNLDHVAYPGKQAVQCKLNEEGKFENADCDYEVCPYDQTGNTYFRIRKCNEPGYEVNSSGSACVKISCSKAVSQFITENTDYALFDGKYLRNADGNITSSARYGVIANNVSLSSGTSCQGALGCAKATAYYSPQYIVYNRGATSSDGVRAMNVACESDVKISSSSALNGTTSTVYTYGVNWSISGTVSKPIALYNANVSFSNAKINASVTLAKSTGAPNTTNTKVTGNVDIKAAFASTGYDYNMSTVNIENKYNDNKKVTIQGQNDGNRNTFVASNLSVKGFAMMRYINATVTNTCLGISCVSSTTYFNESSESTRLQTSSSLNIYDTTYSVANGGRIYMSTSTKIGQSSKEGSSMPETGKIKFAGKTLTNLYMGSLHHKSGWNKPYGSISQYGGYLTTSYTGYSWDFDGGDTSRIGGWMEIGGKSSRSKKQPRNFVCYVDYNAVPHKLYGNAADSCQYNERCQFCDNDGDNCRYYIRNNGYGYGG